MPDSEIGTVASLSDKQAHSTAISEDEETGDQEKDSGSDSEAGSAPYIVSQLQDKVKISEGSPVR